MSITEYILDGVVASAAACSVRQPGKGIAETLESRQRKLEYKAAMMKESIREIQNVLGEFDGKRISPRRHNRKMSPPAPINSTERMTTSILDTPSKGVQEILRRVNTQKIPSPLPLQHVQSPNRPVRKQFQYHPVSVVQIDPVSVVQIDPVETSLKRTEYPQQTESPQRAESPQRTESPQWSSRGRCRPFINNSNPTIPVLVSDNSFQNKKSTVRKLQPSPPRRSSVEQLDYPRPEYSRVVKQDSTSLSVTSKKETPVAAVTPLPSSPYVPPAVGDVSSSSSSSLEPFPSSAVVGHKLPDVNNTNPSAHIPIESVIQNQRAHKTDSRNRGHDVLPPP